MKLIITRDVKTGIIGRVRLVPEPDEMAVIAREGAIDLPCVSVQVTDHANRRPEIGLALSTIGNGILELVNETTP